MLFTEADREQLQAFILEKAESDPRVTAGAVVGSRALGEGDRWSDIDLTFAVDDEHSVLEVLDDWTVPIHAEFGASHLFDIAAGTSLYRVFLLPSSLQFDLSFTPAADFGPRGPQFRLLFGHVGREHSVTQQSTESHFGYAVHHAVRARFCLERGRLFQAEYWISSARDHILTMACRRYGLPESHGRGFDDLPAETRERIGDALPTAIEAGALFRALCRTVEEMVFEAELHRVLDAPVREALEVVVGKWSEG